MHLMLSCWLCWLFPPTTASGRRCKARGRRGPSNLTIGRPPSSTFFSCYFHYVNVGELLVACSFSLIPVIDRNLMHATFDHFCIQSVVNLLRGDAVMAFGGRSCLLSNASRWSTT